MSINQAESPSRRLEPGTVFDGRYWVVSHIGSGGMANVYKVRHLHLEQIMALKLLRRDMCNDPRKVKRFKQEAKSASLLEHANLINVKGFGIVEGTPYLVMEYVEGDSLDAVLDTEERLPLSRVISCGKQIASALGFLHQNHIIHRDIKPANVIATADGVYKVVDFGVAKLTFSGEEDETPSQSLTQTGAIIGTPAYMSPEQSTGGTVDGRSDIYSLGCMLFELATGKPPYSADTHYTMLAQHLKADIPSLAETVVKFEHDALDRVIQKCLAKDPAHRYQTMEELVGDLDLCESIESRVGTGSTRKASAARKFFVNHDKTIRRGMAGTIVAMTLAVAMLAFVPARNSTVPDLNLEIMPEQLITKAEAERQQGRIKSAIQLLLNARARILKEQHPSPLLLEQIETMIGMDYQHIGEYRLGLPHLQKAELLTRDKLLAYTTKRQIALFHLGECNINLRRWDDAAAALNQAVLEGSESPLVYYDLGWSMFFAHRLQERRGRGKPWGAVVVLRDAMKKASPKDATKSHCADMLLVSLASLKRYKEAETVARQLAADPQTEPLGHRRLGMIRLAQGKLPESRSFTEKALASRNLKRPSPEYWAIISDLGLIAYRQRRFLQAAEYFDQAYVAYEKQLPAVENPYVQEELLQTMLWLKRARDLSTQEASHQPSNKPLLKPQ